MDCLIDLRTDVSSCTLSISFSVCLPRSANIITYLTFTRKGPPQPPIDLNTNVPTHHSLSQNIAFAPPRTHAFDNYTYTHHRRREQCQLTRYRMPANDKLSPGVVLAVDLIHPNSRLPTLHAISTAGIFDQLRNACLARSSACSPARCSLCLHTRG